MTLAGGAACHTPPVCGRRSLRCRACTVEAAAARRHCGAMDTTRRTTDAPHVVTVPLGAAQQAKLILDRGTPSMRLQAGSRDEVLVRAQFWGARPRLGSTDNEVTIRYAASGPLGWVRHLVGREDAEVELNQGLPWRFDFRGGIHRLWADLRDLQVASIDLRGGLSEAELWLPRPTGTLRVVAYSNIGGFRIHAPAGAPLRASVSGGIGSLEVQGERFGAVATGIRRETPDWRTAPDRLDLLVKGSVHHLEIA
jgi:hypothetical protein